MVVCRLRWLINNVVGLHIDIIASSELASSLGWNRISEADNVQVYMDSTRVIALTTRPTSRGALGLLLRIRCVLSNVSRFC